MSEAIAVLLRVDAMHGGTCTVQQLSAIAPPLTQCNKNVNNWKLRTSHWFLCGFLGGVKCSSVVRVFDHGS